MQELKLNGHEVNSLQELREHFEPNTIRNAFADGTLERWLRDRYYEREADAVAELRQPLKNKNEMQEEPELPPIYKAVWRTFFGSVEKEDDSLQPFIIQKTEYMLCRTLGVNYADAEMMTAEQRADYDRKLGALRQFTEDPDLLSKAVETATNQSELARLLNCAYQEIILCNASFSVPIAKGNVRYICVGNVKLENAFTAEQYRRAGITVEGIELPETTDKAATDTARRAAKSHGYDDFDDNHNSFASMVHQALKTSSCWCGDSMLNSTFAAADADFFRTAVQAKQAANKVVNAAYDQASAYIAPDSSKNVAEKAAAWYERKLQSLQTILVQLRGAAVQEDALKKLAELADGALPELRRQFNAELREDAGYYKMYQRSYFLEKPEIEAMDDPTESELANRVLRLFSDDGMNYAINGLMETVGEIQDDLDSRAKTFSERAHDLYHEYCEKIEEAAQELGEKLPDGILGKLSVGKAAS